MVNSPDKIDVEITVRPSPERTDRYGRPIPTPYRRLAKLLKDLKRIYHMECVDLNPVAQRSRRKVKGFGPYTITPLVRLGRQPRISHQQKCIRVP